eukprot:gene10275-2423_t
MPTTTVRCEPTDIAQPMTVSRGQHGSLQSSPQNFQSYTSTYPADDADKQLCHQQHPRSFCSSFHLDSRSDKCSTVLGTTYLQPLPVLLFEGEDLTPIRDSPVNNLAAIREAKLSEANSAEILSSNLAASSYPFNSSLCKPPEVQSISSISHHPTINQNKDSNFLLQTMSSGLKHEPPTSYDRRSDEQTVNCYQQNILASAASLMSPVSQPSLEQKRLQFTSKAGLSCISKPHDNMLDITCSHRVSTNRESKFQKRTTNPSRNAADEENQMNQFNRSTSNTNTDYRLTLYYDCNLAQSRTGRNYRPEWHCPDKLSNRIENGEEPASTGCVELQSKRSTSDTIHSYEDSHIHSTPKSYPALNISRPSDSPLSKPSLWNMQLRSDFSGIAPPTLGPDHSDQDNSCRSKMHHLQTHHVDAEHSTLEHQTRVSSLKHPHNEITRLAARTSSGPVLSTTISGENVIGSVSSSEEKFIANFDPSLSSNNHDHDCFSTLATTCKYSASIDASSYQKLPSQSFAYNTTSHQTSPNFARTQRSHDSRNTSSVPSCAFAYNSNDVGNFPSMNSNSYSQLMEYQVPVTTQFSEKGLTNSHGDYSLSRLCTSHITCTTSAIFTSGMPTYLFENWISDVPHTPANSYLDRNSTNINKSLQLQQPFIFNQKSVDMPLILAHSNVHTEAISVPVKNYRCDECLKPFRSKSGLRNHKRIHTGEKPYTCSFCSAKFADISTLRQHERIHTGEKPYKCSHCGKGFAKAGHCRRHERIHTGNRPYSCAVCGLTFSDRSNWKKHETRHGKQDTSQCPICKKTFAREDLLATHLRLHDVGRKHVCTSCNLRFESQSELTRHNRLRHGQEQVSCRFCQTTFRNVQYRNRHERTKHVVRGNNNRSYFECRLCGDQQHDHRAFINHYRAKHPTVRDIITTSSCTEETDPADSDHIILVEQPSEDDIFKQDAAASEDGYCGTQRCSEPFSIATHLPLELDQHERPLLRQGGLGQEERSRYDLIQPSSHQQMQLFRTQLQSTNQAQNHQFRDELLPHSSSERHEDTTPTEQEFGESETEDEPDEDIIVVEKQRQKTDTQSGRYDSEIIQNNPLQPKNNHLLQQSSVHVPVDNCNSSALGIQEAHNSVMI